jgi:hypothetical protein
MEPLNGNERSAGMLLLLSGIPISIFFIFSLAVNVEVALPRNAVWGTLTDFGQVLLIPPCFLAGMFLGQFLCAVLFWRSSAVRRVLQFLIINFSFVFGHRKSETTELSFPELMKMESAAFLKALILVLVFFYCGIKSVYYISPDGVHFSSAIETEKVYPWDEIQTVTVQSEHGVKANSLTYTLGMKNGEQVDLVQENAGRFMEALPKIQDFLLPRQNIHYYFHNDPRAVKDFEDIFGAKAVAKLFHSSTD